MLMACTEKVASLWIKLLNYTVIQISNSALSAKENTLEIIELEMLNKSMITKQVANAMINFAKGI
jgi:hypothetical protein